VEPVERTKPSIRPPLICWCVAFQDCETPLPCAVVSNANERTGPSGPGFQLLATPLPLIFRPRAFGCPDCARPPSRLSKEWFSIITTTMWSNGIRSSTVPGGRVGSGRLSGRRRGCASAEAARISWPAPVRPAAAVPP